MEQLASLTEAPNPETTSIDTLSTLDILRLINQEDAKVAQAVHGELPHIARAVDIVVDRLKRGGRLLYFGAGTSGRLGVLDASELPPTYNVSSELVQGFIAGGDIALRRAREGAEDDMEAGRRIISEVGTKEHDVVVGITASGETPWVLGAVSAAKQCGAVTVALTCNPGSPVTSAADMAIVPIVGPEVIAGSTRMKAGTAQKMVLNMLSTTVMIRLGKVYGNLMVDVQATNAKLRERARSIVAVACELTLEQAAVLLDRCDGQVKTAIIMGITGLAPAEARRRLESSDGQLRIALTTLSNAS
jgi:N-acetylmuramic acid 6-phosphate etherase